jgi:hypothetical protein
LKLVLSNFYAIGFLWRRCNFRGKCRSRYCDVAKTTCGIRQSNYLPLLLYRIPLIGASTKDRLTDWKSINHFRWQLTKSCFYYYTICGNQTI